MIEIIKDKIVLARHVLANSWKDGLSFFSKDDEFIQAGSWKYGKGKELLAHVHNKVQRKINRTQEVIYVVKGKIEANIYTIDKIFVKKLVINRGDFLVLLNCGHGYKILEDNTQVLEIKNGPYLGADIDRQRI